MDDRTIARWRLTRQRLADADHPTPQAAVEDLLGVQAENFSQTIWALAERTGQPIEAEFDLAFDNGEIVRTHVLRPTWHFVRGEDLVWLLELTTPRARLSLVQLQRSLDLEEATMERADAAIVGMLSEGRHLTREEIGERLRADGLPAEGMALGAMLTHAEFAGLVCSGARDEGGNQTYALIEERVPDPRRLDRDEALAEIARRYFAGHGPATERDLAYWATLTVTDVRAGLAAAEDHLDSFEHEGATYWHAEPPPGGTGTPDPRGHLLLILDEYYRGYQGSRRVLDIAGLEPKGSRAVGMALVDGQIVGSMKRTLRSSSVQFDLGLYRELEGDEEQALAEAARRYGAFLDLEPELVLRPA